MYTRLEGVNAPSSISRQQTSIGLTGTGFLNALAIFIHHRLPLWICQSTNYQNTQWFEQTLFGDKTKVSHQEKSIARNLVMEISWFIPKPREICIKTALSRELNSKLFVLEFS
jgi:hypothetical protein